MTHAIADASDPMISRSLLLVIDIQGRLARIVQDSDAVIRNAGILTEGMQLLGVPALVTEQYPAGLGHTVEELQPRIAGLPLMEKSTFSCCADPGIMQAIVDSRRTEIIVCGIEAHVCVYQTVRDLLRHGHTVHVVTDAISSRDDTNRRLAITVMHSLGASLTSTEMILFELLHTSGTDIFKAISKLVR
jgi:nicotinamidase-related amidase